MKSQTQWSGVIYGNPGVWKSSFAATMPKPLKLFMFDPPAKGLAYLQQGVAGPLEWLDDGGGFQFIVNPETKGVLIEIEYFLDKNPMGIGQQKYPCAYERFQASLMAHMAEGWLMQDGVTPFASVVLDSYTFCELACMRLQQYKLNPAPGGVQDSKHNQMQWAGMAKGILQVDILAVLPFITPCHVCLIAHVDAQRFDQQEKSLWGINAVGQLKGMVLGAFSEVYLMYSAYDDKIKRAHSWMMTETDGQFMGQTHVGAPNPCEPTWEGIWKRA